MNAVTRRIASGLVLLTAPVMIALGTATISHADTNLGNAGTSVSHPAFPHQSNTPQPGTAVHHHHQNHK